MNDARRSPRRRPTTALQVTDSLTGLGVGQVGDLSLDGMLLVAEVPVREDALYQFSFHLPDAHGVPHLIEVGVHQAWTAASNTQGRRWVGFRFIDLDPLARRCLADWLATPAGQTL